MATRTRVKLVTLDVTFIFGGSGGVQTGSQFLDVSIGHVYRVLGWNRNRQPGIGAKKFFFLGGGGKISHEMPISTVV